MKNISHNAMTVLESRYLLRNAEGKVVEQPEDLFLRVAKHIASVEKESQRSVWQEKYFDLMSRFLFLPNSPTLMNAGTSMGQLSACFVLPVHDSMESIFETLKFTALIQKSGGGTGFNFSEIRPKNDVVGSTQSPASGPLSFIKIYDAATENIKQGGKRRGANMGVLDVSHPDIEEFILAKSDQNSLRNFNLSVALNDEFMQAVETDGDFELFNPHTNKVSKVVSARYLWAMIVENAWRHGDPGLIFTDAINRKNPTPKMGYINCTNPCGEVPLLPFEPCNLGSVNLSLMVKNNNVDWDLLESTVKLAVRFLDNVIEVNDYVLPEIEEKARGNRKIGLGVMGWADMLIQLEIPYASDKAVLLGEEIMEFIDRKSYEASAELAKERGTFPNWEGSIYYPDRPIRNATRTCIAPTGSISIIAGSSPSIEPFFALAIRRENVLEQQVLSEVNQYVLQYLRGNNPSNMNEILKQIEDTGSVAGIDTLSDEVKELLKISLEIKWKWHVKHLLAFQKYTDNAVSKTINLPEDSSISEVGFAYLYAWKNGAKGITVYREGSKTRQVMNRGKLERLINGSSCGICAG